MEFEVQKWDGLARIGKINVNGKTIETPALFPVVHPEYHQIPPHDLFQKFKFKQIITSAYLLYKRINQNKIEIQDIHKILNFPGVIMMDSGAYQILVYGDIEISQEDSMGLQTQVNADIGVILDHPIAYKDSFKIASDKNSKTLEKVRDARKLILNSENLKASWTLPIQGGKYTDLINNYTDKVKEWNLFENFKFAAIGSVVQIMINQDYENLVKIIITAKSKIPSSVPIHLFGAGHPAMFALAVFLGCDTFDSAAYSLMAKDNRYLTNKGTFELSKLNTLPCICPICIDTTPGELMNLEKKERERKLAEHNLWVSVQEIRMIRNAIERGELWDLVMIRARSAPNLTRATNLAVKLIYQNDLTMNLLISGTQISNVNAIRIRDTMDLKKPEIQIIRKFCSDWLKERPVRIIIAPSWKEAIYNKFLVENTIVYNDEVLEELKNVYLLSPIFGLVPIGLSDLYPISQNVSELSPDDFIDDMKDIILKSEVNTECEWILHFDWKFDKFRNSVKVLNKETNDFESLQNLTFTDKLTKQILDKLEINTKKN